MRSWWAESRDRSEKALDEEGKKVVSTGMFVVSDICKRQSKRMCCLVARGCVADVGKKEKICPGWAGLDFARHACPVGFALSANKSDTLLQCKIY